MLPEDDLRIGTCWSDFKCFNVKFYVSALIGVIIKVIKYIIYFLKQILIVFSHLNIVLPDMCFPLRFMTNISRCFKFPV